jgi:hypothetical protein
MIETNENIETPMYSFDAYWINPEGEITGVPEWAVDVPYK